jgi:hypothetical protein
LLQLLEDCSIVVGLHPDQATEPIVDFALENNKSFAVVPCCVVKLHTCSHKPVTPIIA